MPFRVFTPLCDPQLSQVEKEPKMKSETGRGFEEARVQLEVLRTRWPRAFPLEAREVGRSRRPPST
jgi:hypothetical protein